MITREKVWEVVRGHLVETVEELEGVEVDPSKSMKDLGANSLDIVEVVSCSMRDLKIKVPRSELNKLENMNQLVDLLLASAVEKAKTASAS
jgi:acyl carrier protein